MAATVADVMNPELFSLRASDSAESALAGILALGITAAPVLDPDGRPLGVVSLRDLVGGRREGSIAGARMTSPAAVVRARATIAEAAQLVGTTGYRHLVVVNEDGRAVGMVSAVDLIRGLVGLPATHPAAFPHFDAATGVSWTDDAVLDADAIEWIPGGPGLVALIHDAPGEPRRVVWVEAAANVSTRLAEMLAAPQEDPELALWLRRREALRFRVALVGDPERRERLAAALRARAIS
jgi:CBS domain-containing protein